MRDNKKDPLVSLSLKLPQSSRDKLKLLADKEKRTMNFFACEIIENYIKSKRVVKSEKNV